MGAALQQTGVLKVIRIDSSSISIVSERLHGAHRPISVLGASLDVLVYSMPPLSPLGLGGSGMISRQK